MNIYNDKTIYKLIAALIFIFCLLALALVFTEGGLKSALFMGWCIFILLFFWTIVVFSVRQKGVYSSDNFFVRAASGFLSYYFYRFSLGILVILLVILSVGVWDYLDTHLPSEEISSFPVSEIPKHPEAP